MPEPQLTPAPINSDEVARLDAELEIAEQEANNAWKSREQARFWDGTYKSVPFLKSLSGYCFPIDHYIHLALEGDKNDIPDVSYTPSDDYGKRDRQVRIKFGRYLRKVFPDLADSTIQEAVSEFASRFVAPHSSGVIFATSTEEINTIFETELCAEGGSCSSCMFERFSDWDARPYHVYANSPDVAVAYITCGGDREIIARTVVSTKNKKWLRIYSENSRPVLCTLLAEKLTALGYTDSDTLAGNRLSYVTDYQGNMLLPYIDGNDKFVDVVYGQGNKKYLMVTKECSDLQGSNCNGYPARVCITCGGIDECECSVCSCCDERYCGDSCDNCDFCPDCSICRTHDTCDCSDEEEEEEEQTEEEEEEV